MQKSNKRLQVQATPPTRRKCIQRPQISAIDEKRSLIVDRSCKDGRHDGRREGGCSAGRVVPGLRLVRAAAQRRGRCRAPQRLGQAQGLRAQEGGPGEDRVLRLPRHPVRKHAVPGTFHSKSRENG